jgi:sphingosine kinase
MGGLEKPLIGSFAESYVYTTDEGVSYKKTSCSLLLSADTFSIVDLEGGTTLFTVNITDVVGAKVVEKSSTNFNLEVYSYAYVSATSLFCCLCKEAKKRRRLVTQIDFGANSTECIKWANMINHFAARVEDMRGRNGSFDVEDAKSGSKVPPYVPRKFVVFLNPISGKGLAMRTWNDTISQLFSDAQIEVTLVVTQHANHARTYVADIDPSQFDAILTLGGDGIFYEVLNGLGDRADGAQFLQTVPLYPLPGGTANGLSESILNESGEPYSILNSAFVAVKGRISEMDVSITHTQTQSHHSFLSLSWGLISDVDIRTEWLRCLGDLRLTLGGVYYIGLHRQYRGRLCIYTGKGLPDGEALAAPTMPPIDQPITEGDGWEVIESAFTMVWTLQTSHVSSTMYTAPERTLSDGFMDVTYITDTSRCELIDMLLNLDNGKPFHPPKSVVRVKALAFRLEPLDDGILSLDGEVVEYGPIQGVMQQGKAKTFKILK